MQDVQSLATLLLEGLPSWHGELRFDAGCKLLASLLNKKADGTLPMPPIHCNGAKLTSFASLALPEIVDNAIPTFWERNIKDVSIPLEQRRAALRVYGWALRGLVLRSESKAYEGVSNMLSLFAEDELANDSARALEILGKEGDNVLTKENFAVIRVSLFAHIPAYTKNGSEGFHIL